jgi:2-oxoglutarate ferredoxin oxidoreductase subunit alpha
MVEDVRLVVGRRRPVGFFGRAGGVIPTPAETLGRIERMAADLGLAPAVAEGSAR